MISEYSDDEPSVIADEQKGFCDGVILSGLTKDVPGIIEVLPL